MKKSTKETAINYFKQGGKGSLFVNKKGELFTNYNLALGSVKSANEIKEVTKDNLIKTTPDEPVKTTVIKEGVMVMIADDKTELTFPAIKNEVRELVKGDQALVKGKEAEGTYTHQGDVYVFEKGTLTGTSKN